MAGHGVLGALGSAELDLDWEGDYRQKNGFITSVASLSMCAGLSTGTIPTYRKQEFGLTGIGVEAADLVIYGPMHHETCFWGGYKDVLLGPHVWPTVPLSNELDTVEIVIDPERDEFDLSLLNEREREFFENFVGAFDPGPNFTEDDLTIDDLS